MIKTIAMQAAPIDRNDRPMLRTTFLTIAASVLLAGCGGGAQTTDLPTQGGPSSNDNPYNGPVARDASVLKFQQEFWANAKTTDRCGSCHNETVGQQPMFVRNDDINLAYDAAVTVTDVDQPSASRLVERVDNGHHCWVEDTGVCATIMTTWIENWVGEAAGGGRQIVLGALTLGDLFSFTLFLGFLIAPIVQMANIGTQRTAGISRTTRTRSAPTAIPLRIRCTRWSWNTARTATVRSPRNSSSRILRIRTSIRLTKPPSRR